MLRTRALVAYQISKPGPRLAGLGPYGKEEEPVIYKRLELTWEEKSRVTVIALAVGSSLHQ